MNKKNKREKIILSKELELEAKSFDRHILERIRNGHIPDLRLTKPCDWFKNNVWRRPYLVNMLLKRVIDFSSSHLIKGKKRILEVGCGPGHMCLELARLGFNVLGIDISSEALRVARKLSKNKIKTLGSLEYIREDFLNWLPENNEKFDAVLFYGTLHHFINPSIVLDKVLSLLTRKGRIIVYEPARDFWGENEIIVMILVRILLSASGSWYENITIPQNDKELKNLIVDYFEEIQEAKPRGCKAQSPMDNSSYGKEMLTILRKKFKEIGYENDTLLFDRIVGGIRLKNERQVEKLSKFLQIFELYSIKKKFMKVGGFMFAGKIIKNE